jgi:transketolase
MDAVQQAKSGHPGTPMALAPVVYCLWQRVLRFDPEHPIWPNRDRFVLSVGHASMLLYSMLHLTGVQGRQSEVRNARRLVGHARRHQTVPQLDSNAPATRSTAGRRRRDDHRSARQGLATSVGMAIAERWLASYFNRPASSCSTTTSTHCVATAA